MGSGIITLTLFWVMLSLVRPGDAVNGKRSEPALIIFRQAPPPPRPEPPPRQKPRPKPPEKQPPRPQLDVKQAPRPVPKDLRVPLDASLPLGGSGPALLHGVWAGGPGSGALVPLVRISPPYPYRAALAGIEGWVTVEFTVTETGAVTDARVIDAQPPRIFNEAAIKAILNWRFQPKKVDGIPIRVRATQTMDFHLAGP